MIPVLYIYTIFMVFCFLLEGWRSFSRRSVCIHLCIAHRESDKSLKFWFEILDQNELFFIQQNNSDFLRFLWDL